MFPNIRLMIVTVLAAILGIGCGLGLFATFRVNHEPLARLSDGSAPLQLAWEKLTPAPRSLTLGVDYPIAGAAKPIVEPASPQPIRADLEAAPPAPSVAAVPGGDQTAGETVITPSPRAGSKTDVAVAPPAEPSPAPAQTAPAVETAPAPDDVVSNAPAADAASAAATAPVTEPAPAAAPAGETTPTAEAAPATEAEIGSTPAVAPAAESTSTVTTNTPAPVGAPTPQAAPTTAAAASPTDQTASAPAAETETVQSAAATPTAEPPLTTETAPVANAASRAETAPSIKAAPINEASSTAAAAPASETSQGAPVAPASGEDAGTKPAQNGATAALTIETTKPTAAVKPADEDRKAAAKEERKPAVKREAKAARAAPPVRRFIKLARPRTTRTAVTSPAGDLFSQPVSQPAYQWTDNTQTPQTIRRVVVRPRRVLLRKTAPQSPRQSRASDQGSVANAGLW